MDLRITGGNIVCGENVRKGNIYIKDGIIQIITTENIAAKNTFDAAGKFIFPGAIDAHVHFNDGGYSRRETFLSGSKSAAKGGVTTVMDMPLQNEPNVINAEIYKKKAEAAGSNSYVDFCLWGGFVNDNICEFEGMAQAGAKYFKAFMCEAGEDYPFVNNGIIKKAMEKAVRTGITLGFHCEDYHIIDTAEKSFKAAGKNTRKDFIDSRPLIAEIIAVKNIIDLAHVTGAKVHICHVSHPLAAEEIRKAKSEGISITAETCPHYLVFTEKDMVEKGTLLKCAPPLRSLEAKENLWEYVLDGTIDCIVSDHSPATPEEKLDNGGSKSVWDVWSGISGVQTGFQVIFNEAYHNRKISPSKIADIMSGRAAKVFGLYPNKGIIQAGSDGDLAILDPDADWEITSESLLYTNKISGFEGLKGKGAVAATILSGKVIYDGKDVKGPYGKWIKQY